MRILLDSQPPTELKENYNKIKEKIKTKRHLQWTKAAMVKEDLYEISHI